MAKPKPRRRPTVRVDGNHYGADEFDGWGLSQWTKFYTDFAKEHGVDPDDVRIDVEKVYEYDDSKHVVTPYFYREQTREEELAQQQAVKDAQNAERERVRAQIALFAEKYPELMPYQVQELP